MNKKYWLVMSLVFAIIVVYYRLTDHPANFAPLTALALFAGAKLPKRWGLIVPLATLFVTDLFLGFYEFGVMAAVYGCLALAIMVGWQIKKQSGYLNIITASLACSIIFFLATNLAVWGFSNWYTHDLSGLSLSYYLALPFFRNTLFSDLFFSLSFFSLAKASESFAFKQALKKIINGAW